MERIRLAVISDIHVGEGARSQDLRPDECARTVEESYLNTFKSFVKTKKIDVDFLAIPGDLTCKANESEFNHGSSIIGRLLETFGLGTERAMFVPGNHDVDWEILRTPGGDELRKKQRYDPLKQCAPKVKEILSQATGDLFDDPCFVLWDNGSLLCIGINSAFYDGPDVENHPGWVKDETMKVLQETLASHPANDERLRMLIVHHHPLPYKNPIPNEPDFSTMQNGLGLIELLSKHRFDLLIHGHKHAPYFQVWQSSSQYPVVVLCAGSFSAQLNTRWGGIVNNQFHEVAIDGRENGTGYIYGEVRSWTYISGHGWIKSNKHNGIRHIERFGSIIQPEIFKAEVRPTVANTIGIGGFLKWSDVAERGGFRYLPPEMVRNVLNDLASEIGFEILEREDDTILIPREVGR